MWRSQEKISGQKVNVKGNRKLCINTQCQVSDMKIEEATLFKLLSILPNCTVQEHFRSWLAQPCHTNILHQHAGGKVLRRESVEQGAVEKFQFSQWEAIIFHRIWVAEKLLYDDRDHKRFVSFYQLRSRHPCTVVPRPFHLCPRRRGWSSAATWTILCSSLDQQ